MKQPAYLLLSLWLLSVPLQIYATAQTPERILIDGCEKALLTLPIDKDSVLSSAVSAVTGDGLISTGCYRGYVGKWQIEKDRLYLLELINPAGEIIQLPESFLPYKEGDRYEATWFTGELRVGEGDVIYHSIVNLGFSYYFARETFYELEEGTIVKKRECENTFFPGTSPFPDTVRDLSEQFDFDKFPELKHLKRIILQFQIIPTAEGKIDHILRPQLRIPQEGGNITITDPQHPYLSEILSLFYKVPQWDVVYIYGEKQPLPRYTIPLKNQKFKDPDK